MEAARRAAYARRGQQESALKGGPYREACHLYLLLQG